MPTDEIAAIVKHSEHVAKVQDQSTVLEDEALTKA